MAIMIDIETLGTSHNSVILSIGAVEFNNRKLGQELYLEIDAEDCVAHGLQIDVTTVFWWFKQSEAARQSILERGCLPLKTCLVTLIKAFNWKDQEVWCNGTSFDFPILENAFKACGLEAPWDFWMMRDFRTLKNIMPRTVQKAHAVVPVLAHHALEDAKAQALMTISLLDYLGGNSATKVA